MSILDTGFGRVLHERRGIAIHGFFELMVVVYETITLEDLQAVSAAQRELHAQYGRIAGLSILRSQALSRPEAVVRDYGQKVSDEFDTMGYASAVVLNESGMGGAFYRSILTGIHLASRRPVPQRVFASGEDAVTWILSKSPASPLSTRVTELQRRVAQLTQGPSAKPMGARGP